MNMSPGDRERDMNRGMDMMRGMDMAGGGTLTGTITRSAAPANGGVGPVFVALFERNPVIDMMNPGLVAFQRIENVDFNPAGTMVTYELTGIPPRPEVYYITAFLDDNMSASVDSPESAGPDRGDLVALDGFASPSIAIDSETTFTKDLVLSISLPF